jgi:glucokinase
MGGMALTSQGRGLQTLSERTSTEYTLGLDIGGTKIAGGVVAFPEGRLVSRRVIPTRPERGGQVVLEEALALAESLQVEAATQAQPISGVGVGLAELVDLEGNVTSAHTLDWRGFPVQALFSRLAPAIVESDVRAPALAEAYLGAGRPFRLFLYVTIGTGISCCLVQEGRPYAGARGGALVMASSPFSAICPTCGSLLQPVTEEIASGPALVARYRARLGAEADPTLTQAEAVIAAAGQGDQRAIEVIETAGLALGSSLGLVINILGLVINILDPEAVVIGGGLGSAGGLYWDNLVEATRQHIWSEVTRTLPILPAALGPEAGLIGAAATAWKQYQRNSE